MPQAQGGREVALYKRRIVDIRCKDVGHQALVKNYFDPGFHTGNGEILLACGAGGLCLLPEALSGAQQHTQAGQAASKRMVGVQYPDQANGQERCEGEIDFPHTTFFLRKSYAIVGKYPGIPGTFFLRRKKRSAPYRL